MEESGGTQEPSCDESEYFQTTEQRGAKLFTGKAKASSFHRQRKTIAKPLIIEIKSQKPASLSKNKAQGGENIHSNAKDTILQEKSIHKQGK